MSIDDKLYEAGRPFEYDKEDCYLFTSPSTGETLIDALTKVLQYTIGTKKYIINDFWFSETQGLIYAAWVNYEGNLDSEYWFFINN